MDVRRPKQKAKREIRRSNIALDDYMFERKMQALYYGKKPTSDDTPALIKFLRLNFKRSKYALRHLPTTARTLFSRLKGLARRHPAQFFAGFAVVSLAVIFGVAQLSHPSAPGAKKSDTGTNGVLGESKDSAGKIPTHQTPEFPVVLPQGKTADQVGGFAKVSPAGAAAAYAYTDKINGVDIQVSEQLLPDNLKTSTSSEVEKLALGFNATQSVKTEKTEFFIGANTNGQQSVITYTKTLLILIKSSAKISNERWTTYIEDLK